MSYFYTTDDDGNDRLMYRDDETGETRRIRQGEDGPDPGVTQWQESQGIYSPDSIYDRAIRGPDGQEYIPVFNTTRGGVSFTKDLEQAKRDYAPYAGSVPGSQNLITGPDGNVYAPRAALDQIGKMSQSGGGFIKNFLNGPGAVLLPAAVLGGAAFAASGAGGAGGAGAAGAGAGGGAPPASYWSMLAGDAPAGGISALGGAGLSAADTLGLTQMGIAAGLPEGSAALAEFVASGGTIGSTVAGGTGAAGTLAGMYGYTPPAYVAAQYGSAADKVWNAVKKLPTNLLPKDSNGDVDWGQAVEKYGPTLATVGGAAVGAAAINDAKPDLNAGPDLQKQEEDRKAGLRQRVNALFDADFSGDEKRLTDAMRGQYGDELKDLYGESRRNLKFSLARAGQVGGSLQADKLADLEQQNRLGSTRIEDAVQSALSNLRSEREATRGRTLSLVDSGSGEEAVRSGQEAIKAGIDLASSQQRQALFSDMFNEAAYMSALRSDRERGNAANAYYGQRRGAMPGAVNVPTGPTVRR